MTAEPCHKDDRDCSQTAVSVGVAGDEGDSCSKTEA